MFPNIGPTGEPGEGLGIQAVISGEIARVNEAPADIADRPLDLALGLCPVWPAGTDAKAPVGRETEKLGILDQLSTLVPQVPGDDAGHLVEEDLAGHAAEEGKRFLQAREQRRHVLTGCKLEPEQTRVAEHNDECVALPPGEVELGEIDLT